MRPDSERDIFGNPRNSSIWAWRHKGGEIPPVPFQQGQIVFLFNLGGESRVETCGCDTLTIRANEMLILASLDRKELLHCTEATDLLAVGLDRSVLAGLLEPFRPGITAEMRSLLFGCATRPNRPERAARPLPDLVRERIVPAFCEPLVSGAAKCFWYESKVRELIALFCFPPSPQTEEFFCSRQKRLAVERVAKTKAFLEENFEHPVELQRIASHIGCSSFYISRTFSSVTGTTISQYVRRLRVERAAELILSGRFSVSEAAVEVGYQSLSHFSKAFQVVKGCLPSKYDAA